MKKKLLIIITTIIFSIAGFATPVMAAEEQDQEVYQPIILKDCGSGDQAAIQCILDTVVDIFTIGVGILGVIGISIAGVQYLTSSGNEEQAKKAKRRILEIVVGLAFYAVIFGILKWIGISRQ